MNWAGPSHGSAFLHSCYPHGESLTNNLLDTGVPLKAIFALRVQEIGASPQPAPLARIA